MDILLVYLLGLKGLKEEGSNLLLEMQIILRIKTKIKIKMIILILIRIIPMIYGVITIIVINLNSNKGDSIV